MAEGQPGGGEQTASQLEVVESSEAGLVLRASGSGRLYGVTVDTENPLGETLKVTEIDDTAEESVPPESN